MTLVDRHHAPLFPKIGACARLKSLGVVYKGTAADSAAIARALDRLNGNGRLMPLTASNGECLSHGSIIK